MKSLSCVRLSATPWTAVHQAPPSMRFSRREYWSGLPLLSALSPLPLSNFVVVVVVEMLSYVWLLWSWNPLGSSFREYWQQPCKTGIVHLIFLKRTVCSEKCIYWLRKAGRPFHDIHWASVRLLKGMPSSFQQKRLFPYSNTPRRFWFFSWDGISDLWVAVSKTLFLRSWRT